MTDNAIYIYIYQNYTQIFSQIRIRVHKMNKKQIKNSQYPFMYSFVFHEFWCVMKSYNIYGRKMTKRKRKNQSNKQMPPNNSFPTWLKGG